MQTKIHDDQKALSINIAIPIKISAVAATFPLCLNKIDCRDINNTVQLDIRIVSKINETVIAYAKEIDFSDSIGTYTDLYFNTIQLQDSLQTIYLILLKHYPTANLNVKVLFYDNQKMIFADSVFDFNLFALDDLDKDNLKSSNLKKECKIIAPEIELGDYNHDGRNDFKFTRLYHNGTSNSLFTTIIEIKNRKINTLFFKEILLTN
ncbi:MAG: hypothetical protein ABI266_01275 [Ginsengibacter sp.]